MNHEEALDDPLRCGEVDSITCMNIYVPLLSFLLKMVNLANELLLGN